MVPSATNKMSSEEDADWDWDDPEWDEDPYLDATGSDMGMP
jgi:hypothetical protein